MLNIIVYEDKENFMQKNITTVNRAFANNDIDYRIYKFNKYSKKIDDLINDKENKKIYILDVETNDVSGIEVASRIREVDYDSIIIFATAYEKYRSDVFYSRLMVLDYVPKYSEYETRLYDDLTAAIKIVFKEKTFVFSYNHVVYRIPYNHICYIEKEPIIKRCIIHTIDNNFYIVKPINWLVNNLSSNFMRVHQSCIVNLDNIKEVDCSNNVIIFKNGDSTCLLADKKKKEIKMCIEVNE